MNKIQQAAFTVIMSSIFAIRADQYAESAWQNDWYNIGGSVLFVVSGVLFLQGTREQKAQATK